MYGREDVRISRLMPPRTSVVSPNTSSVLVVAKQQTAST